MSKDSSASGLDDRELYRQEAIGAFSHEIRTPLTSLRMVLELARQGAQGGQLVLDSELAGMLDASIADLQQLADDLQEVSQLERGKLRLSRGPADLCAAFEAAAVLLAPRIQLAGDRPAPVLGPWDPPRLVRALAGFAEATHRIGDGRGLVHVTCTAAAREVGLTFRGGDPGGAPRSIGADAATPSSVRGSSS